VHQSIFFFILCKILFFPTIYRDFLLKAPLWKKPLSTEFTAGFMSLGDSNFLPSAPAFPATNTDFSCFCAGELYPIKDCLCGTRYGAAGKLKAGVAELADAPDSKSGIRKDVWVRAPPPVDLENVSPGPGCSRATIRRRKKFTTPADVPVGLLKTGVLWKFIAAS